MKPIIRRSNAATGKDKRVRAYQPQAPKKVDSKEEGIARRHARIPEQLSTTYSISPAADPRARARQVDGPGPSLLQSSEKFKEYKKKLLAGKSLRFVASVMMGLMTCGDDRATSFEKGLILAFCFALCAVILEYASSHPLAAPLTILSRPLACR